MIFVTVGNMDPFDRLLQGIDDWIASQSIQETVFAQIGKSQYQPKHFQAVRFLTPQEYRRYFEEARFVIAHAGMGSIITAIELSKYIVVMPKRASLGEQRNEHQLATARHFQRYQRIRVAENEHDLPLVVGQLLSSQFDSPANHTDCDAETWPPDKSLIQFVNEFLTSTSTASSKK